MATKTWKIGEVCRGGIITVETTKTKVTIIAKEWDYSKGSRKSSDQSQAKEWNRLEVGTNELYVIRKLDNFLHGLTTSYYADQVLCWIKDKAKLVQPQWF